MSNMEFPNSIAIGVLAIQGGFVEHISHLTEISKQIQVVPVRSSAHLHNLDGLVIPGGETTVMSVFLEKNERELLHALRKFVSNKPVWGTCAGMIVLANQVDGQMKDGQVLVGGMNINVCRNFYGSQLQSFEACLELKDEEILKNAQQAIPMLFIRAPGILGLGSEVKILAKHNDLAVAVRQNYLLATSFHPELTTDLAWHLYFVKMVLEHKLRL